MFIMFSKRLSIALMTMLALAASVQAQEAFDETNFYFGGELSFYNKTTYNGANQPNLNLFKTANSDTKLAISKNEPGINIFGGLRLIQSLALEVGFGFISKASASVQNGLTASNKISNIYLDALGFLRVAQCVDLLGSVGIGGLKSLPSVTNTAIPNKAQLTNMKLGYRVGGGAQYYYNENWSTRAFIRYQSGNKDFLRGLTSISVGVVYTIT